MTQKQMLRGLGLSPEDFKEIEQAVKDAESKTSGEIVLAATAESSSYAFWELLWAGLTSVLMLVCLFPLASQIYDWLGRLFWGVRPWYLAAFYVLMCALMIFVIYLLYNIPAIDGMIIPTGVKNINVTNRAMRCFAQSGVYATDCHGGILVFVSCLERQVRIVADKGISAKISQDLWNLIADEMTERLAAKDAKGAFVGAAKRCGELLAEYFPAEGNKKDELSNGLIILEDEQWV